MDSLIEAEISQAILWPQTILGMPRPIAAAIGLWTLIEVVAWAQLWFIVLALVLVLLARPIGRIDRYIFEISWAALRRPTVLD